MQKLLRRQAHHNINPYTLKIKDSKIWNTYQEQEVQKQTFLHICLHGLIYVYFIFQLVVQLIEDAEKVVQDLKYWIPFMLFFPFILVLLKWKPKYFQFIMMAVYIYMYTLFFIRIRDDNIPWQFQNTGSQTLVFISVIMFQYTQVSVYYLIKAAQNLTLCVLYYVLCAQNKDDYQQMVIFWIASIFYMFHQYGEDKERVTNFLQQFEYKESMQNYKTLLQLLPLEYFVSKFDIYSQQEQYYLSSTQFQNKFKIINSEQMKDLAKGITIQTNKQVKDQHTRRSVMPTKNNIQRLKSDEPAVDEFCENLHEQMRYQLRKEGEKQKNKTQIHNQVQKIRRASTAQFYQRNQQLQKQDSERKKIPGILYEILDEQKVQLFNFNQKIQQQAVYQQILPNKSKGRSQAIKYYTKNQEKNINMSGQLNSGIVQPPKQINLTSIIYSYGIKDIYSVHILQDLGDQTESTSNSINNSQNQLLKNNLSQNGNNTNDIQKQPIANFYNNQGLQSSTSQVIQPSVFSQYQQQNILNNENNINNSQDNNANDITSNNVNNSNQNILQQQQKNNSYNDLTNIKLQQQSEYQYSQRQSDIFQKKQEEIANQLQKEIQPLQEEDINLQIQDQKKQDIQETNNDNNKQQAYLEQNKSVIPEESHNNSINSDIQLNKELTSRIGQNNDKLNYQEHNFNHNTGLDIEINTDRINLKNSDSIQTEKDQLKNSSDQYYAVKNKLVISNQFIELLFKVFQYYSDQFSKASNFNKLQELTLENEIFLQQIFKFENYKYYYRKMVSLNGYTEKKISQINLLDDINFIINMFNLSLAQYQIEVELENLKNIQNQEDSEQFVIENIRKYILLLLFNLVENALIHGVTKLTINILKIPQEEIFQISLKNDIKSYSDLNDYNINNSQGRNIKQLGLHICEDVTREIGPTTEDSFQILNNKKQFEVKFLVYKQLGSIQENYEQDQDETHFLPQIIQNDLQNNKYQPKPFYQQVSTGKVPRSQPLNGISEKNSLQQ